MDCRALLVFVVALASCCLAVLQCPQECRCRSYRLNGVHAVCSKFEPEKQIFSQNLTHLKVHNYHPQNGFSLKNRVFTNLGLSQLESIEISNSSLNVVEYKAFHGLKNLKTIDFSNDNIKVLDPDTFIENQNLNHLVLSGNPISFHSIPEQNGHFFINSDSIVEVILSNCNISVIPPKVFSSMVSLEYIDLSGNDLTEVTQNTFGPLINLEVIKLANNSISKIDRNSFADMDGLTVLSLSGNPIKTLEGIEIQELKELDVSDCDFEILMSSTFSGFPQLYLLNLSRNAIRDINKETFTDLSSLRYLDLSHNNIRGPLDSFLFEYNNQLETLSLAGNKELHIFQGFSTAFHSLYRLDLSQCGINNLAPQSFHGMPLIDSLNISGNYLSHIPPKTFSSLNHLTILDLSKNKLHSLNNKIFFNNMHLSKLYLSHNYFTVLPAILFSGTPTLYWLDLSHNHATKLWNISESFVMKNRNILSKLSYLNVSGNRLKTLHMHSFISMRALETLDITSNPIICTQDFSHVMQWLIGKHVMPSLTSGRNSENLSLIKNNIQWEEILNEICPIDLNSRNMAHKAESLIHKMKNLSSINHITEITENPDATFSGQHMEDVPYVVNPVSESESSLFWPIILIWVSILSMLLAVANIIALVVYKSRRVSSTTYSRAPGSLNGHFLVRRGGKSVYKKLYEECSEPAQIHGTQSKTSRIITIFGFPQNRTNSSV